MTQGPVFGLCTEIQTPVPSLRTISNTNTPGYVSWAGVPCSGSEQPLSVTGSCKPSLHRIYMFLMREGSVSAQSSICTEWEVCAFLCHCGLKCLPLDSEWADQQVHGGLLLSPWHLLFWYLWHILGENQQGLDWGGFQLHYCLLAFSLSSLALFDEYSPPFSTQGFLHMVNAKCSAPTYIPIVFECYVGVQMF